MWTPRNQKWERRDKISWSSTSVKPRRRWLRRLMWGIGGVFLCGITFLMTFGFLLYQHYTSGLPDIEMLKTYQPSLITKVYTDRGELLTEFFVEKRILVPLSQIPPALKAATIAVEDARFYEHTGIDIWGILRAAWMNLQAGEVVQGGSTITQQLTKTLLLSPQRTMERKIQEAILAQKIEHTLSKDEILELYLNQIYYGHGAYGVEAAANTYFGKHVTDLTLAEAATLAGLPRAPANYSPYLAPQKALQRRQHVLHRMVENNFITPEEAEQAAAEPLQLRVRQEKAVEAPYFVEQVRQYVEERYSSTDLYRGGLRIYTTLNREFQRFAEEAIRKGVIALDKRRGYRGPLSHISSLPTIDWQQIEALPWPAGLEQPQREGQILKGVVTKIAKDTVRVRLPGEMEGMIPLKEMAWAAKPNPQADGLYRRISRPDQALTVGDVVAVSILKLPEKPDEPFLLSLEQEPIVQGALVCLEVSTGAVKALVGGYDFGKSQFNRAVQAVRQPGSAFKPLIYATALTKGFTPASIIVDAPFAISDRPGNIWKPMNFDRQFHGPTTLRTGLTHSRNIVAIKLLQAIGPQSVIELAQQLGIQSSLYPSLALALGSSGVTPLELTTAYNVFANRGVRMEPFLIRKITDRYGNVLEETRPIGEPVLSPQVAYLMTSMLQSVVQSGTGQRVKALQRPVAGKTGTTNDFIDAWFVGYTPSYTTGVWVGLDNVESLGNKETGSRAAIPIWLEFMQQALEGKPAEEFEKPAEGLVTVRIDPETGLQALPEEENAITEIFLTGTEPGGQQQTVSAKGEQRGDVKELFRKELR